MTHEAVSAKPDLNDLSRQAGSRYPSYLEDLQLLVDVDHLVRVADPAPISPDRPG